MIDFTEIAPSNVGGEEQDTFELFSRDFLEEIGFKIIQHPYRGADGGKDMIVSETRIGNAGETTIKYLVSCKHQAHSNKAVGDSVENNILDRVKKHKCDGFIAVYSTIAAPTVSNTLDNFDFETHIYDHKRIEKLLLETKKGEKIVSRYFRNSYLKYKSLASGEKKEEAITSNDTIEQKFLTRQDIFNEAKSAIVVIEIEKIREDFLGKNWLENIDVLDKLSKYAKHSNEQAINDVLHFLNEILAVASGRMPVNLATEVFGLVTDFFPTSYEKEEIENNIENGKLCIYIGFNMAYDATIKSSNLTVVAWALTILKYIYKYAKQHDIVVLKDEVHNKYNELEATLRRPERNDLEKAQKFVAIFKDDLENWDLSFPAVPYNYYQD